MPQIARLHGLIPPVLLIAAALSACSDPKTDLFDPDTGRHKASWMPALHADAASSGTTTAGNAIASTGHCVGCHGEDLAGGISGVSCSACHIGGPTAIHPPSWFPIVLAHGPSLSSNATSSAQCASQYCHGPGLAGVPESGPACSACHTEPFTPGSVVCGSCHAIPPAGQRYPNVAGRHAVHAAFTGTTTAGCSICHSGSDGVTSAIRHYDMVLDVAFAAAYNALTGGPAAFHGSGTTCAGVSCHGGQVTPNWFTGSLDVHTQCTACHSYGTSQHNSFNSGEHNRHVNRERIACTSCHDTGKLAPVHFNDLNTTAMNQAAATLGNQIITYSNGSCNPRCHDNESW